jgi:hypothetical protein
MFLDLGIISVLMLLYVYLETLRPFKYERGQMHVIISKSILLWNMLLGRFT